MWEGYTPSPQAGAETRFPRMFTLDGHAHGAQRRNENSSWEGCALPNPPRWRVVSWEGCALPNPPAGGLFSPQTVMRMAHNAGMKIIIPGRAAPSQTLPRAGWFLGGGRGAAAPRPYAQTLPRAGYVHLRAKGSPYGLTVIAPRVIQGPAFPATSSAWTRTR